MPEPTLFDQQEAQLARVTSRIEKAVLEFMRNCRNGVDGRFSMEDLLYHVQTFRGVEVAPDSPGRILRSLRRRGLVRYRCVNRAKSLYEIEEVRDGSR